MDVVPCGLCGGASRESLYPLIRGAIVRCADCGFRFVSPRVPLDERLAKIQRWAKADVIDAERLRIAFDSRTMALYGRYLLRMERALQTPGRRLLDVGCATGAFMAAAKGRGWAPEGLEIGEASSKYAADHVGVPVHRYSLFEFESAPDSFDAIVFLEVIEHLDDPLGAMRRIAGWLRPGGVALISTPNFDSLFRRVHGTKWWVVNCEDEHIGFFDLRTLKRTAEAVGLELVWSANRSFDVAGFLHAFRTGPVSANEVAETSAGYYGARQRKEQIKHLLGRIGVLGAVRFGLAGLDTAFSSRWSPVYGLGEQLVLIARKPPA